MPTLPNRYVARILALTVSAVVALALTLVSAPANAAWTNSTKIHGAQIQVCKVKVKAGWRVKMRLNGRNAKHAHRGTLFRIRGNNTKSIKVRANRGKLSRVKSMVIRSSDGLDSMVSEINGPGAGGAVSLSRMRRC